MNDLRTPLEIELHATIKTILLYFETPKIWKSDFVWLMGQIRNAQVRLDNKRLGCKTGAHASACLCNEGTIKAIPYRRFRPGKAANQ